MKKNSIRFFIMMVLLVPCYSSGQTMMQFEILGGRSYYTLDQGTLSNWGDGWIIGGEFGYRILPHTDLTFNLLYSKYFYTGNNIELAFPAIAGLRYSVSGQPSNTYETSVGIRFNSQAKFINPFISLRAGVFMLNEGDIIISQWFDSNPQNVSHTKYYDSGVSSTNLFAGVGIGFIIPVSSRFGIGVEGRFSLLMNAKGAFLPVLASFQYIL